MNFIKLSRSDGKFMLTSSYYQCMNELQPSYNVNPPKIKHWSEMLLHDDLEKAVRFYANQELYRKLKELYSKGVNK